MTNIYVIVVDIKYVSTITFSCILQVGSRLELSDVEFFSFQYPSRVLRTIILLSVT